MANVISYRPGIGKLKLEKLVKNKLHYKNLNQFIDHAVSKTLNEEMGVHPTIKKITREVEKAIYKYVPLKFVNATGAKEVKEMKESLKRADKKGGWASTEQIIKKHHIH